MLDRPCVCQHYDDNKNECSKYGTKYKKYTSRLYDNV